MLHRFHRSHVQPTKLQLAHNCSRLLWDQYCANISGCIGKSLYGWLLAASIWLQQRAISQSLPCPAPLCMERLRQIFSSHCPVLGNFRHFKLFPKAFNSLVETSVLAVYCRCISSGDQKASSSPWMQHQDWPPAMVDDGKGIGGHRILLRRWREQERRVGRWLLTGNV